VEFRFLLAVRGVKFCPSGLDLVVSGVPWQMLSQDLGWGAIF
jgi:hypothetical protein